MLVTKFSRCILQTNTATQTLITNHASLTKMLAKSMLKKPQKGTLNEYHKYPHFSKIRVASLQFDKKHLSSLTERNLKGIFSFRKQVKIAFRVCLFHTQPLQRQPGPQQQEGPAKLLPVELYPASQHQVSIALNCVGGHQSIRDFISIYLVS